MRTSLLLLSLALSMVAAAAHAQLMGDCDDDGSAGIVDALKVAQHSAGLSRYHFIKVGGWGR